MQSPPILNLMSQQIASECDAKLAAAKAESARIREEARLRAAHRREELLALVEKETAEASRRARERAESESEMVILTTKDTVTDEVLGRVRAELTRMASSQEFVPVLDALLGELISEAPEGGIVLVPVAHEAHCREWLASNGRSELEVQARREFADGVAVQDKTQSFRVTNTLGTRFEQLEASLRKYCVAGLFGEGA